MRIRLLFPCACNSETDGSSREDTEEVRALGNMISGKAIPEKTPYTESASDVDSPLIINFLGSCIVSTVEIRLTQTLFRLIGKASEIMDNPLLQERDLRIEKFLLSGLSARIKQDKKAEENSPASIPRQI